jgi:DNA-binding NarL/FixJ family response regulator
VGTSNGVSKRLIPPPHGLIARRFDADRDELVVFTWGDHPPEPLPLSLTAAEHEVLALIVSGASNRAIAERRRVAARTIANQVASILRKARARSRFELIRRFSNA